MRAIILVGGKATRLLPLTCNTPKAMVPVLNKPFLEHVIHHLDQHGIKEIIMAQGHLAQPIQGYLGDGSQLGVKFFYSFEDTPLGTAGAVKNASEYLAETFVVLNGDVFTDFDITEMIAFHREKKARITIALTRVDDPTSYGLVETTAEGRVTRFLEKPSRSEITTDMINAGTYIIEPDVLAGIPPHTGVSFEREVFPKFLTRGEPIYAYSSPAYWIDIGTPQKYLQIHRDLLSGQCRQHGLTADTVLIGEHSEVHPTVEIKGPVVIAGKCSIERHVKLTGPVVIGTGSVIREDSVVEASIIWQRAKLGPRAILKQSILADDCCLDEDSICEDAVLGDGVIIKRGVKLAPGSRLWPGTIVEGKA